MTEDKGSAIPVIEPKPEQKKVNTKKKSAGRGYWFFALIVILVIGYFVTSNISMSYDEKYTYMEDTVVQETETYFVKEPVKVNKEGIVQETYTEQVPFTDKDCSYSDGLYDSVFDNSKSCIVQECVEMRDVCVSENAEGDCTAYDRECARETCTNYRHYCSLTITNKDDEVISGLVNYGSTASTSKTEQAISIPKNDDYIFDWNFEADKDGKCQYDLNIDLIEDCKIFTNYRTEEKVRDVAGTVEGTELRDVEKTRVINVTKPMKIQAERRVDSTVFDWLMNKITSVDFEATK